MEKQNYCYAEKMIKEYVDFGFLRTLKPEDVTETYVGWLNDPEVTKYLATKSATLESLKDYVHKRDAQVNCLFFGIYKQLEPDDNWKKTPAKFKMIGTLKLEFKDDEADVAIMIGDKTEWGKGYGPIAVFAASYFCLQTLFNGPHVAKVTLGVVKENTSAIKAYGKLGMKQTRVVQQTRPDGTTYENVFMEVTGETLRRPLKRTPIEDEQLFSCRCGAVTVEHFDIHNKALSRINNSIPPRGHCQCGRAFTGLALAEYRRDLKTLFNCECGTDSHYLHPLGEKWQCGCGGLFVAV